MKTSKDLVNKRRDLIMKEIQILDKKGWKDCKNNKQFSIQ